MQLRAGFRADTGRFGRVGFRRGAGGGSIVTLTNYEFDTAPDPDTYRYNSSHLGTEYWGFWPAGTAPVGQSQAAKQAIKDGTGAAATGSHPVGEGESPPIPLNVNLPEGTFDFRLVVQATDGGGFSNIVGHTFTVTADASAVSSGMIPAIGAHPIAFGPIAGGTPRKSTTTSPAIAARAIGVGAIAA